MNAKEDNRMNRKKVKGWMRLNFRDYDNSTQAAEACADALDIYENTLDYKIPEYVFEVSMAYYDDNGPILR